MDEEQSGNRNRAGLGTAAERTLQGRQEKSHRLREDIGIIRQPVTRKS